MWAAKGEADENLRFSSWKFAQEREFLTNKMLPYGQQEEWK